MTPASVDRVAFTPRVDVDDAVAAHWLRQATVRLRREVTWRWHLKNGDGKATSGAALPPQAEPLLDSLDLARYADDKRTFFETDSTARYLGELLDAAPSLPLEAPRGSFAWLSRALSLDEAASFALALALLATSDHAAGPVVAALQNDHARATPSLALAQHLWDRPTEMLALADDTHPLWTSGIFAAPDGASGVEWTSPLVVAVPVALRLLRAGVGAPPATVTPADSLPDDARALQRRVAVPSASLRVVPVRGPRGADLAGAAAAVSAAAGRALVRLSPPRDERSLRTALASCWLDGVDAFVADAPRPPGELSPLRALVSCAGIPVTVYAAGDVVAAPEAILPTLDVAGLTYAQRVELWRRSLGRAAANVEPEIVECSRRFRYERSTIESLAESLTADHRSLAPGDLTAACRSEVSFESGGLAIRVEPRFGADEIVLPPAQSDQLNEIEHAMRHLTTVHYQWGTARAWNESGISVLFAGPSGTGKTMAAEVLAAKLDLPMFKINLSRVVDKYIGETEKNLDHVFAAADACDSILFFDEADALFGRRTEVKDAHDRYANLEVSFLLERMERFHGCAVLATNRRKDLDEAFARRLRYVVTFPFPAASDRKRIWERVLPPAVDASALDVELLAGIQLTGGNIRSVVFNACLQAGDRESPRIEMTDVLLAVRRELDKIGRLPVREQFGQYAWLLEDAHA